MAVNAFNTLAADGRGLDALKRLSRDDSPEALKAAAKQFEAMFLQMVIKSMREASPGDELTGSSDARMYQDMLDQQWAAVMSERGTGLSRVLEQQLAKFRQTQTENGGALKSLDQVPVSPGAARPPAAAQAALRQALQAAGAIDVGQSVTADTALPEGLDQAPAHVREFVTKLWPHAQAASRETGIPPQFLIAQAALETGWGRNELAHADGQTSHNLFNIKAGGSWDGPTLELNASEYVDGRWVKQASQFRSYASYADSFSDYARLLASRPRYAPVLGAQDAASFARGLQNAGYATDPAYAVKLERLINSSVLRSPGAG